MIEQFTKDDLRYLIQNGSGLNFSFGYVSAMATQLLAEMDKPGVWDDVPEDVVDIITYRKKLGNTDFTIGFAYTRELTKSPSRIAAEKRARELYEAGVDAIADEIEKKEAGK